MSIKNAHLNSYQIYLEEKMKKKLEICRVYKEKKNIVNIPNEIVRITDMCYEIEDFV